MTPLSASERRTIVQVESAFDSVEILDDPLCPYAHHRGPKDWTGPTGKRFCGICHPPGPPEAVSGPETPFEALDPGQGSASLPAIRDGSGTGSPHEPDRPRLRVVSAQDFAAAERPGAHVIIGEPGDAILPEAADLILYGDGGASKTTLTIDLACHLAAGEDWLGALPIPRPRRVALIEAEGPAAPFAEKLGRKLAAWKGPDLADRLLILEEPWAEFDFDRDLHVADALAALEVDVLIAGPISTVGLSGNGTIGEVRGFMGGVSRFRERVGRPLATILVHHDNAARRISGAFEGACDTLIQAEVTTPGRTSLYFEKCRWSPSWHKQRRRLAWTDGEGFEISGADNRDLLEEILAWVRAHPRRPTEDVVRGVDARAADVRAVLNEHLGARFKLTTGADALALGAKSSRARLWEAIEDVD